MSNADRSTSQSIRRRGRPRGFDTDAALDSAIGVFMERGYHGTSISDLTEAMRLSSGSVYKAFEDKRGVFLAALDRYVRLGLERRARRLEGCADGAEKLRAVLSYYADNAQGHDGRLGCLVVSSAAELAETDPEIAERVSASHQRLETQFAELIQEGQEDGSIAAGVDVDGAARLLLAAAQGFRVLGKTGRSRDEMMSAVDSAMALLGRGSASSGSPRFR